MFNIWINLFRHKFSSYYRTILSIFLIGFIVNYKNSNKILEFIGMVWCHCWWRREMERGAWDKRPQKEQERILSWQQRLFGHQEPLCNANVTHCAPAPVKIKRCICIRSIAFSVTIITGCWWKAWSPGDISGSSVMNTVNGCRIGDPRWVRGYQRWSNASDSRERWCMC